MYQIFGGAVFVSTVLVVKYSKPYWFNDVRTTVELHNGDNHDLMMKL